MAGSLHTLEEEKVDEGIHEGAQGNADVKSKYPYEIVPYCYSVR